MTPPSRPEFRAWVDRQPDPKWPLMPLTHICKSLVGNDIARAGAVEPADCAVLKRSLAYFFYGRPAYRTKGDGPVKNPAACPMCFVFDPNVLKQADEIHPFDTGAFESRLYHHIIMDEMRREDFSLEQQVNRPNKLISAIYGERGVYFEGDNSKISVTPVLPSEFLAYTYVELLKSAGRNEPDDRVGTVEVIFESPVPLKGNLLAVVVPDILWSEADKASWIVEIGQSGVDILPFKYSIGREPEHHHAMIEVEIRQFYASNGYI